MRFNLHPFQIEAIAYLIVLDNYKSESMRETAYEYRPVA